MSDEEIDVLLARLERSVRAEIWTAPKIYWAVSALLVTPVFVPELGAVYGVLPAVMGFLSWAFSRRSREEWRRFGRERALFLWNVWAKQQSQRETSYIPSKTAAMRERIGKIYRDDPSGETLPIKQAFRLMETYGSGQQKLQSASAQLNRLRESHSQLLDKAAQLRELGEISPKMAGAMPQIEADLASLETARAQIESSCARLEGLLTKIAAERQIKRLQNEIGALASGAQSNDLALLEASETGADLTEIEHQISHEIETFLRLERETDQNLREL